MTDHLRRPQPEGLHHRRRRGHPPRARPPARRESPGGAGPPAGVPRLRRLVGARLCDSRRPQAAGWERARTPPDPLPRGPTAGRHRRRRPRDGPRPRPGAERAGRRRRNSRPVGVRPSLTNRGWSLCGAGAALLVGARVLGVEELAMLAAAAFLVVAVAFVRVRRHRLRLSAQRALQPTRAEAGSPGPGRPHAHEPRQADDAGPGRHRLLRRRPPGGPLPRAAAGPGGDGRRRLPAAHQPAGDLHGRAR